MKNKNLTKKQANFYQVLKEYLASDDGQRVPTMKVISEKMDFKSPNTASCYMERLCEKGYAKKIPIGNGKHHYVLPKIKVVLQEIEK